MKLLHRPFSETSAWELGARPLSTTPTDPSSLRLRHPSKSPGVSSLRSCRDLPRSSSNKLPCFVPTSCRHDIKSDTTKCQIRAPAVDIVCRRPRSTPDRKIGELGWAAGHDFPPRGLDRHVCCCHQASWQKLKWPGIRFRPLRSPTTRHQRHDCLAVWVSCLLPAVKKEPLPREGLVSWRCVL